MSARRRGERREYVLEVTYKAGTEPASDARFRGYAEDAVRCWGGQLHPEDVLFYPFRSVRVRPPRCVMTLADFHVVRLPFGNKYLGVHLGHVDNVFRAAAFGSAEAAEAWLSTGARRCDGCTVERIVLTSETVRPSKGRK